MDWAALAVRRNTACFASFGRTDFRADRIPAHRSKPANRSKKAAAALGLFIHVRAQALRLTRRDPHDVA